MLPSLRPGMRLLDVGCGPGSITRGLAQRLAPGEVVGLDLSRETLAAARKDAVSRGLTNLTYAEGSVYELPLPRSRRSTRSTRTRSASTCASPPPRCARCCARAPPRRSRRHPRRRLGHGLPAGRWIRGSIGSSRSTSRPRTRTAASRGWGAGSRALFDAAAVTDVQVTAGGVVLLDAGGDDGVGRGCRAPADLADGRARVESASPRAPTSSDGRRLPRVGRAPRCVLGLHPGGGPGAQGLTPAGYRLAEEVGQHAVEDRRLIQVRRVAGARESLRGGRRESSWPCTRTGPGTGCPDRRR